MVQYNQNAPRGLVFLSSLWAAITRVPVWIAIWLVFFLASFGLSLRWVGWFGDATAGRYEPGSLVASLGEVFRFDHRAELSALREGDQRIVAAMGIVMMLFGAFAAGGWLQVFLERTSGRTLRRFLWGGARYYWRFFRLMIVNVCLLAGIFWLCEGWVWKTVVLDFLFGAEGGELETLASEQTAQRLVDLQQLVLALFVGLLAVWATYTRTRLALHNTRSVLWAGLCSLILLIANPIRTLRPMAIITALELGVIYGLGRMASNLNAGMGADSGWRDLLVLFVFVQAGLLWQIFSRGARYNAAVQISRFLVPPLVQPDQWGKHIGGPGGPQYPIDDSDEYNVSI